MLTEQQIEELRKNLPWVYFVGIGCWSSEEDFAWGATLLLGITMAMS